MKLGMGISSITGVLVLLGAADTRAWDPSAAQRGWVDAIGTVSYPGPVFGPTYPMSIRGWACVRPGLPEYGVPPNNLVVYHGGQQLPLLPQYQIEDRPDAVQAGACAGTSPRGFIVWVARPVNYPSSYRVDFVGPYGTVTLEGQSAY